MPGEPNSEITRRRVVYTGRVQGVCFRVTALELCQGRPVVGFVRNLPNRTVELEAQGTPAEVADFLDAVASQFAGYITDAATSTLPLRADEHRFQILY